MNETVFDHIEIEKVRGTRSGTSANRLELLQIAEAVAREKLIEQSW